MRHLYTVFRWLFFRRALAISFDVYSCLLCLHNCQNIDLFTKDSDLDKRILVCKCKDFLLWVNNISGRILRNSCSFV